MSERQSDSKPIRCRRSWPLSKRLSFYSSTSANGCREWNGNKTKGYGTMWWDGRVQGAHRLSYIANVGPIPNGAQVCHRCDNPGCIEPAHLFLGDHAANAADKVLKGRQSRCLGAANGRAKLSAEEVDQIRQTTSGQRGLSARFGVNRTQIARIRNGLAWKGLA